MVIALMTLLAGAICVFVLPTALYPEITPPVVQVAATFTGANANTTATSVTQLVEEAINGVQGMIYMSSISTNQGASVINVTFDIGYDQDIAAVDVQNRLQTALPQLPDDIRRTGVQVNKVSPNILLVVNLLSPKGTRDSQFLGNYADIQLVNTLRRIPGVAQVSNIGLLRYAMRVWLDIPRINSLGLTPNDVITAIRQQSQQVAAGSLGASPDTATTIPELAVSAPGRLRTVEEFENIVVRAGDNGVLVRLGEVARVELGAESYNVISELNNQPASALAIYQLPDANALTLAADIRRAMDQMATRFPEDVAYSMVYDTTRFIDAAIEEVQKTFIEAGLLVILVVFVFLQSWRSTLIALVTIPVSIIGTFAFMAALGFSINMLTLLGLVLAIGLVVDDAIVVVENIERRMAEHGGPIASMFDLTADAMREVQAPIIGTSLVLFAVFVPAAFLPGIVGQLYNQFALTVAVAVLISTINALTLSPALGAILLRPAAAKPFFLARAFNWSFDRFNDLYTLFVKLLIRLWPLTMAGFVALLVLTGQLLWNKPTGFVPPEDQGYFIVAVQGMPGFKVDHTQEITARVQEILRNHPAVEATVAFSGFDILNSTAQGSSAVIFVPLKPWDERQAPELHADAVVQTVQRQLFMAINNANVLALSPPPLPGMGSVGGFELRVQDLENRGLSNLMGEVQRILREANQRPELNRVFTSFSLNTPQLFFDLDRDKAQALGLNVAEIFSALQAAWGGIYVNDFNEFGKTYRVFVQADGPFRDDEIDLTAIEIRNRDGLLIPLSAVAELKPIVGPFVVPRYNTFPAISINGSAAPGFSSGQAIAAMEDILSRSPREVGYEWTGLTYQELKAGNAAVFIFALSFVFVYLVLAALYESWIQPVMVLLAVPLGLLGAVLALDWRDIDLDVYGQIGLLMLIGLVAKNAILIVEFARELREQGASIYDAAVNAMRLRLRPILMTALSFILGVLPLMFALGAGAGSRQSLGTTVFGGLLLATVLVMLVPVFYYVLEHVREVFNGRPPPPATPVADAPQPSAPTAPPVAVAPPAATPLPMALTEVPLVVPAAVAPPIPDAPAAVAPPKPSPVPPPADDVPPPSLS